MRLDWGFLQVDVWWWVGVVQKMLYEVVARSHVRLYAGRLVREMALDLRWELIWPRSYQLGGSIIKDFFTVTYQKKTLN